MGERRERPTQRLESSDLAALAKQSIVADETAAPVAVAAPGDDPLADWEDLQDPAVATGSQSNALPTTSRTATLADPLTTQLLAEVARRTATMELDPTTLNLGDGDRQTREIDPEALRAALLEAERTPIPTTEPTTKRKAK